MNEAVVWQRNAILAKLSDAERQALVGQFKEVSLTLQDVVHEQRSRIERVYFSFIRIRPDQIVRRQNRIGTTPRGAD